MPLKPSRPSTCSWVDGMKRYSLAATAALLAASLTVGARPSDAQQPPPTTPQLSINDVLTFAPGRTSVTSSMIFVVTLLPPSPKPVAVFYTTADPSPEQCAPFACAAAGVDYVPTNGVLTFAPGEPPFKIIRVPIINGDVHKPNRAFAVLLLNPTNAPIAKPFGIGRIPNQRVPTQSVECATEIPGLTGNPIGFVQGKDGNFWMTDAFLPKLLVFDPRTRKGADVALPPFIIPHFINNGPDGNLWFSSLTDQLGRVDPATRAVSFVNQGISRGSVPHVVVGGPDGKLYFSEEASELIPDPLGRGRLPGNGRLGQLDLTTGTVTEFSAGLQPGNRLHGLDIGPDGNPWVTLGGTDQLVRFNLATKTFDRFVQFSRGSNPQNVLTGPDGNLYITLEDINKLGRYNPRTGEVREFATSLTREDGPSLLYFAVGPDRNSIWFTEFLNDRVGIFDIKTEQITEVDCGLTPGGGPIGVLTASDNAVWVSEVVLDPRFPGRLARLVPSATHRFTDANRGFVTSLYRDLLGREPEASAVEYFSGLLQQGRANRFQVAQAIANSKEARAQAVQRTYLGLLGRPAATPELATALGLVEQGGIQQVEALITSSDEYFQRRAGGTSDSFLAALYTDLVARTPNPGDQLVFSRSPTRTQPFDYIGRADTRQSPQPPAEAVGQLGLQKAPDLYPAVFSSKLAPGGSRVTLQTLPFIQVRNQLDAGGARGPVAEAVIYSPEHAQKLVRSFFGGFIFRPAQDSDLAPLVDALVQGVPLEVVLAAVVATDEYRDRRVLGRS